MLIKDKDILDDKAIKEQTTQAKKNSIDRKSMSSAWGDAFDYYLRGTTERYMLFHSRATRLEFWGFFTVLGLLLIVLYALGKYIDIPLALYYMLASVIPAVAVATRRLHDVNKNALIYLGIGAILPFSFFIISYWCLILILFWLVLLIHLFSKETVAGEGLYGDANQNDEVYGQDSIRIIHKFRFLALCFFVILAGIAYINFDNWARQAEYRATNDAIMEKIEKSGHDAGLTDEQIKTAQDVMKQTLKSWNGKEVKPEAISQTINKAIQQIKKPGK